MYIYMYRCIFVCMYIYTYIYICIDVHLYVYVYSFSREKFPACGPCILRAMHKLVCHTILCIALKMHALSYKWPSCCHDGAQYGR